MKRFSHGKPDWEAIAMAYSAEAAAAMAWIAANESLADAYGAQAYATGKQIRANDARVVEGTLSEWRKRFRQAKQENAPLRTLVVRYRQKQTALFRDTSQRRDIAQSHRKLVAALLAGDESARSHVTFALKLISSKHRAESARKVATRAQDGSTDLRKQAALNRASATVRFTDLRTTWAQDWERATIHAAEASDRAAELHDAAAEAFEAAAQAWDQVGQ